MIVSAPVGSGKSAFAAQAAEDGRRTLALVKTKSLQDQYGQSYQFQVLKGKNAYDCGDWPAYSADDCAECEHRIKQSGKCVQCQDYSSGIEACLKCGDPFCDYTIAYNQFMESQKGCLNYTKYLVDRSLHNYGPDIAFLDEAHQLEDIALDYAGIQWGWQNRRLQEYCDPIELDSHLLPQSICQRRVTSWLQELAASLEMNKKPKPWSPKDQEQKRAYKYWEETSRKVETTLDSLVSMPECFFVHSDNDKITIKPLTARFHFTSLFDSVAPKIVLMSATIPGAKTGRELPDGLRELDASLYARSLGLTDYEAFKVPNVWPGSERPVRDMKAPKLGQKVPPENWVEQARIIAAKLNELPEHWTGLIHVTSRKLARDLSGTIERLTNRPVWIPIENIGTEKNLESFESFCKNSYGGIGVSYNFSEGIDAGWLNIIITAKCLTPDMQLFGPDGYISIDNAEIGKRVFAVDDNGQLTVDEILSVIKQPWNGNIYTYKSQSFDLSVTDNHQMLIQPNTTTREWAFEKIQANEIEKSQYLIPTSARLWVGNALPEYFSFEKYFDDDTKIWYKPTIMKLGSKSFAPNGFTYSGGRGMFVAKWPDIKNTGWTPNKDEICFFSHKSNSRNLIPFYWRTDLLLAFVGWFVTEGHSRIQDGIWLERKIIITQDRGRHLQQIIDLVNEIGLPFCLNQKEKHRDCYDIVISCGVLYRAFTDWCGIGARNKKLPRFILDSSATNLQSLFTTMMLGDGNVSKRGMGYYTSSDILRDNFIEIGLKLGHSPRATAARNGNFAITLGNYRNRGTVRPDAHVSISYYNGLVWCVTTKSGNILATRNGKFVFTGNCPYPDFSSPYEYTKFNYDKDLSLSQVASIIEQQQGRNRRGYAEHYGPQAEKFNGIADGNWQQTQIQNRLSDDFLEAVQ